MAQRRAFVLLSGGMDSTTCLHQAILDFRPKHQTEEYILDILSKKALFRAKTPINIDWVEAISIDYGQRHVKEANFAARTCEDLGIPHKILNVQGILDGKGVMLSDASVQIPNIGYEDIKGVSPTYVPFRNGTLLSLITAYAQKWVNERIQSLVTDNNSMGGDVTVQRATDRMKDSVGIYFGAHAEDAANWAYPDCTPEFIGAMANAIYIGSYMCIRLYTPLQWLPKSAIVALGEGLNVNWENTWSCYAGGEQHCGTCPTCRARKAAFKASGYTDPTDYAA